jgi:hypothetical protein
MTQGVKLPYDKTKNPNNFLVSSLMLHHAYEFALLIIFSTSGAMFTGFKIIWG